VVHLSALYKILVHIAAWLRERVHDAQALNLLPQTLIFHCNVVWSVGEYISNIVQTGKIAARHWTDDAKGVRKSDFRRETS
jgi:hypothetical protein